MEKRAYSEFDREALQSKSLALMWPSVDLPIVGLVASYAIARMIAVAMCVLLAIILTRRRQIPVRFTLVISALCVPVGVLSAQTLDMAEYSSSYISVGDTLMRRGSSIYGAFLAVFLLVPISARFAGLSPLRFLDGAAPSLALGEAITRVGCFCAGCCYGTPWNGYWAVTFPPTSFAFQDLRARGLLARTMSHTMPLHPVQLYATIMMVLVTIGLLSRLRRQVHDGEVFALFLMAYGVERLSLAPFRMEALASMKVFSVLFIALGLAILSRSCRIAWIKSRVQSAECPSV